LQIKRERLSYREAVICRQPRGWTRSEITVMVILIYRFQKTFRMTVTQDKGSGENYVMRSLMICTPHPIFSGDKIEKNKLSEACSVYGERRGL
jgi:hypothetical protein